LLLLVVAAAAEMAVAVVEQADFLVGQQALS
jgi:hypothetical protein